MDVQDRFDALARQWTDAPGVTLPDGSGGRAFGSAALKVRGSIFAMLTGGRLVVKLPRQRVAELIAEGTGAPFSSGRGTPMKEWVAVVREDEATWSALAAEAHDFVGAREIRR